jgi:hypothetical protein
MKEIRLKIPTPALARTNARASPRAGGPGQNESQIQSRLGGKAIHSFSNAVLGHYPFSKLQEFSSALCDI